MTTLRPVRALITAFVVALGLVITGGCSSGSSPKSSVKPVMKASAIADAIDQYKQSFTEDRGEKVCAQLFPTAPTGVLGADAGSVMTTVSYLDMTCEFMGDDCVADFLISQTSSGRVDPVGLTPKDGHYLDYGDDNGVQISETVGSRSDSAPNCVVSIPTGKTSIQYLNDALARFSKD